MLVTSRQKGPDSDSGGAVCSAGAVGRRGKVGNPAGALASGRCAQVLAAAARLLAAPLSLAAAAEAVTLLVTSLGSAGGWVAAKPKAAAGAGPPASMLARSQGRDTILTQPHFCAYLQG